MFQWLQQNVVVPVRRKVASVVMPADHPIVLERKQVCASCPSKFSIPVVGAVVGEQCIDCGCFLDAKTRTVREKCPRGKW